MNRGIQADKLVQYYSIVDDSVYLVTHKLQ